MWFHFQNEPGLPCPSPHLGPLPSHTVPLVLLPRLRAWPYPPPQVACGCPQPSPGLCGPTPCRALLSNFTWILSFRTSEMLLFNPVFPPPSVRALNLEGFLEGISPSPHFTKARVEGSSTPISMGLGWARSPPLHPTEQDIARAAVGSGWGPQAQKPADMRSKI